MNVKASLFDGNIPLMMEKAKDGAVFIMRNSQPEYVLFTIEVYEALIVPSIGTEVDPSESQSSKRQDYPLIRIRALF